MLVVMECTRRLPGPQGGRGIAEAEDHAAVGPVDPEAQDALIKACGIDAPLGPPGLQQAGGDPIGFVLHQDLGPA